MARDGRHRRGDLGSLPLCLARSGAFVADVLSTVQVFACPHPRDRAKKRRPDPCTQPRRRPPPRRGRWPEHPVHRQPAPPRPGAARDAWPSPRPDATRRARSIGRKTRYACSTDRRRSERRVCRHSMDSRPVVGMTQRGVLDGAWKTPRERRCQYALQAPRKSIGTPPPFSQL